MPDRTLEASSAPPKQTSAAPEVVVNIHLLADGGSNSGRSNLKATLANLASDLMSTSGGALRNENEENIAADFPDLQSAIRAARRLHWALAGLMESEQFRGCSARILIHSAEHEVKPSLNSVFANCEPGQVLLSLNADLKIENIPGLRLSATQHEGWRGLHWRKDDAPTSFADDEQSVLRVPRDAGREDPSPVVPELPVAATEISKDAVFASQQTAVPANSISRRFENTAFHGFQPKPWRIATGAAAIVCLAAVLFIVLHHSKPAQSPTSSPAATTEQFPAAPTSQSEAPPPKQSPPKVSPSAINPHASNKPAITEPKTVPVPNSASCDLTEGDIQRSLARADRNLHDGKLAEAEAEYRQVLGCPSARERAQDGLNRVAARKTAQDGGMARLLAPARGRAATMIAPIELESVASADPDSLLARFRLACISHSNWKEQGSSDPCSAARKERL